jgi:probable DNA metabolism protein
MPEIAYRYLRLGFSAGAKVRTMIADPRVAAFHDLARSVLSECEHTRQFVRFSHMADGSYVASFSPKANTVPLTSSHFAARMGTERFCLVDPRHGVAAFHEAGQHGCEIALLDKALAADLAGRRDFADDEAYVRAMWQRFYAQTTTPGRDRSQRGYDLRMKWMPQRLWGGLTELDELQGEPERVPARYQSSSSRLTG